MEGENAKKENKSQIFTRSSKSLVSTATKMIERLGMPFICGYLHPVSNKVVFLFDSSTKASLDESEVLDKIECVLYKSHKTGKSLNIVTNEILPGASNENPSKVQSHLPKPKFKLISERSKFDYDLVRSLLGSALAAEGFGRGTGKMRYKEPANKPAWFDNALEEKIGLGWDRFSGVNTAGYKKERKEVMFEIIMSIYGHHLENVDEYYIHRSEEFDLTKDEHKKRRKQKEYVENVHELIEEECVSENENLENFRVGLQSDLDNEQLENEQYNPQGGFIYHENDYQDSVPAQYHHQTEFSEPLSNFSRLLMTPRAMVPPPLSSGTPIGRSMTMAATPVVPPRAQPSLLAPTPRPLPAPMLRAPPAPAISLRPSNSRMFEEIEDDKTCKISTNNKNKITKNLLDRMMPEASPFQNPKRRRLNSRTEIQIDLTPNWIEEVFREAKETVPGRLQLINWRYRKLGENDHLCCTLSDGVGVSKHIVVAEGLEDNIKEASLYSVIEVTEATIIDGCMLLLEDFEFVSTSLLEPVSMSGDIKHISKDVISEIMEKKGMFRDGVKQADHPGFARTPIVRNTRSRAKALVVEPDQPRARKVKTGGFSCDQCAKIFKKISTFNVHKC